MLKKGLLLFTIVLIFALAACAGGQAAQATQAPTQASQPNAQANGNGGRPNSLDNLLAIGTLKLEGTALAVTGDEAKQLLPLWQKVQTLMADTNSTAADIQTAYQQIQQAMTPDQITAIQQMNLTQADIQAELQTLGIQYTPPAGGAFQGLTADQRATRIAQLQQTPGNTGSLRGSGGASGTPGANGGFSQTPGANGSGRGFRGGMSALFIDPLIQLLQQRGG